MDEKDLVTYYSTRTEELEKKVEAMERIQQKLCELTGYKAEAVKAPPPTIASTNPLFANHFAALSPSSVGAVSASEVELINLADSHSQVALLASSPTVARLAVPTLNRAMSSSLAVAAAPSATRVKPAPPPRRMQSMVASDGAGAGELVPSSTAGANSAATDTAGTAAADPVSAPKPFARVPPTIGRRVNAAAAGGVASDAKA